MTITGKAFSNSFLIDIPEESIFHRPSYSRINVFFIDTSFNAKNNLMGKKNELY